jgi:hypothetical protein
MPSAFCRQQTSRKFSIRANRRLLMASTDGTMYFVVLAFEWCDGIHDYRRSSQALQRAAVSAVHDISGGRSAVPRYQPRVHGDIAGRSHGSSIPAGRYVRRYRPAAGDELEGERSRQRLTKAVQKEVTISRVAEIANRRQPDVENSVSGENLFTDAIDVFTRSPHRLRIANTVCGPVLK